jgi:hypothetical protein
MASPPSEPSTGPLRVLVACEFSRIVRDAFLEKGHHAWSCDLLPASARPVRTFKQAGVEVSVWRNPAEQGDMYNASIRKSYKDDKSGEWKETSLSPTDLVVVSQLSSQAFQGITELEAQSADAKGSLRRWRAPGSRRGPFSHVGAQASVHRENGSHPHVLSAICYLG